MADSKSPKNIPTKKKTPKKSPKSNVTATQLFRSPLKRALSPEWDVPPSPKSLELMYNNVRKENVAVKFELQEFFTRLLTGFPDKNLRDLLLEKFPLMKLYDFYLELKQCVGGNANGDDEGNSEPAKKRVYVTISSSSNDA